METSPHLNELAAALSRFQGEVRDAPKDAQGHGYMHATLPGVLEIVRPLLCKYELSVAQPVLSVNKTVSYVELNGADKYGKAYKQQIETYMVTVVTILMHSSGQFIKSSLEIPVSSSRQTSLIQAIGGAITYARRYCLVSILGIGQVDDDGSYTPAPAAPVTRPPSMSAPKVAPIQKAHPDIVALIQNGITERKIEDDTVQKWLSKANVSKLIDLPADVADKILDYLLQNNTEPTRTTQEDNT